MGRASPGYRRRRFNPRPCARGDPIAAGWRRRPLLFQSTPLREGRLAANHILTKPSGFQSTPLREGRRGSTI